jgi:hypothetical protein
VIRGVAKEEFQISKDGVSKDQFRLEAAISNRFLDFAAAA